MAAFAQGVIIVTCWMGLIGLAMLVTALYRILGALEKIATKL